MLTLEKCTVPLKEYKAAIIFIEIVLKVLLKKRVAETNFY